mmetsp:Transcript_16112/g.16244  ORF Transcript_16112/g.16244 Transcript_16112/m.16244 type:complete len:598 (-) Transcript_16112:40-1833(-)|eukprot:CAMPEP_0182439912 /NCGR_PEP_ID=MMETSP1167-20130531/86707_1 /TAXON_ID=2988 /ORGANISM="Mallomonas Sp, Strain CCMP3275" /LENGTH=597 /DNA_ID=CAMNT_0024633715 /DNA_START=229 /DNA_END=2022 /DNA_ORIENTATION=+
MGHSVSTIDLTQQLVIEGGYTAIQSLTTSEIGNLMNTSLLPDFRQVIVRKNISGKHLKRCGTTADYIGLGIPVNEKAKHVFDNLIESKKNGVPRVLVKTAASKAKRLYIEHCKNTRRKLLLSMKAAKYRKSNYIKAGFNLLELKEMMVFSPSDLISDGWDINELYACGYTPTIEELKDAGNTASQLVAAGVSLHDLVRVNYHCRSLLAAGFTLSQLIPFGFSTSQFRDAGCTVGELLTVNFTPKEILLAGYPLQQCLDAGIPIIALHSTFPARAFREMGCDATQMKQGGFTAFDLRHGGYTIPQITEAGYSVGDIVTAGFHSTDIKENGYTVEEMKRADIAVEYLRKAGFSLVELLGGDYLIKDVLRAGFTVKEMIDAQVDPKQLYSAGASVIDLHSAGCTLEELDEAGCTLKDIISVGYSLVEVIDRIGHYSLLEMYQAGISAEEVKSLKKYTARDMKEAGYSYVELAIGFTIKELREGGFTIAEMQIGRFSLKELKAAGYPVPELKAGGYTPIQMLASGFTHAEMEGTYLQAELDSAETQIMREVIKQANCAERYPFDPVPGGYRCIGGCHFIKRADILHILTTRPEGTKRKSVF